MSIANEIARLQQAKADIAEAIVAKGGEVSGKLDTYAQAIEALPSGGGGSVACLEGDITLASTQNNIIVTHNLGVIPLFAEITITSEYTPASARIWTEVLFANPIAGATPYGANLGQENNSVSTIGWSTTETTSQYYAWFRTDVVRFYSGASSRLFFAGTYHYKIYYAI